jgi:hypothetical protein
VIDFLRIGCLTLNVADLLLLAGGLLYGHPFQASERAPLRVPQCYGSFEAGAAPCAPAVCSAMSWAASATPVAEPRAMERVVVPAPAPNPRRSPLRRGSGAVRLIRGPKSLSH